MQERDILPAIEIQDRYFLDNVLDAAFLFDMDEMETIIRKYSELITKILKLEICISNTAVVQLSNEVI